MTIFGSIISLSNSNKLGKNQKINSSSVSSLQNSNCNAGTVGNINRGLANYVGEGVGIVSGALIGGIAYTIEGAIVGFGKGLAFGIL